MVVAPPGPNGGLCEVCDDTIASYECQATSSPTLSLLAASYCALVFCLRGRESPSVLIRPWARGAQGRAAGRIGWARERGALNFRRGGAR